MTLIQCTQKLLKELPIDQEIIMANFPSLLGNWHANLIRIERRKCVLFTNDETLYSFFIPGVKKQNFQNLASTFMCHFILNFKHEGLDQYKDVVMQERDRLEFTKSSSRSVLGTMNNMSYIISSYISRHGGMDEINYLKLNYHINNMPFNFPLKDNKYDFPIHVMKRKLGCPIKNLDLKE